MNKRLIRRLGKVGGMLTQGLMRPFLWLGYAIGHLFPRRETLWAFGSWKGMTFSDNAKWLFLYCCSEGDEGIQFVWLSRSRSVVAALRGSGLRAEWLYSPRGLWTALRAGTYITDADTRAISFWTSGGVKKLNLFHGMPLKRIRKDIQLEGHRFHKGLHGGWWQRFVFRATAPWLSEASDLMIALGSDSVSLIGSAFGLKEDQILATGFPRNDVLTADDRDVSPWRSPFVNDVLRERERGRKIVAYLPTFRDYDREGRTVPLPWAELDEVLARANARLLIKMHPHDQPRLPDFGAFTQITPVPAGEDVGILLREVDVLVTDYSSVFFDFLLLDRPIVFYPYDLEDYVAVHRGLYFDYEAITPGPRVTTGTELCVAIEQSLAGADSASSSRARVLGTIHSHVDGRASERVYRATLARFVSKGVLGEEDARRD
jgi:CDP-glycerol glycerophosphotransferase (TagB/SpsB family)